MAPVLDLYPRLPHRLHSTRNTLPTSRLLNPNLHQNRFLLRTCPVCQHGSSHSKSLRPLLYSSLNPKPLRYAVLGAGFAGLSVAWHLLELTPNGSSLSIDIVDEVGIGGGASGAAGGLLHPYSPKAKVLWKGAECWKECLKLLDVAERASNANSACGVGDQIVWRRGILRPAMSLKSAEVLMENAQNYLEGCNIKLLDKDSAQDLIPGLVVPFNAAVHMPLAVNIHPKRYLEALFLACKSLAADSATSECGPKVVSLHKKSVGSLYELAGIYPF